MSLSAGMLAAASPEAATTQLDFEMICQPIRANPCEFGLHPFHPAYQTGLLNVFI